MTDTNAFKNPEKEVWIRKADGSSDTVMLGARSWDKRKRNEVIDNARPNNQPHVRKIQNINRIDESHSFSTIFNDDFVAMMSEERAQFPDDVETKEDVEEILDEFFESQDLLEVRYGRTNASPHIIKEGYMTEYNVEEVAERENSIFRVDFTFLVGQPMS